VCRTGCGAPRRDDYDVVALAGLLRLHLSIELLDQGENKALVLGQELIQVMAAPRPAGVAVVVHHTAAREGLVDLGVEVVSVGEDQEGEIATELPVHLAGEKHH
jgi:hypothetical protein